MASFRVLADGKIKFSMLVTKPIDPAAPTAAELNAGIDMSCKVLSDNFNFGPTDSDKVSEPALCTTSNAQGLGRSNGQCAFTVWRYFATAGGFDLTDDAAFAALKLKGTTVWFYGRRTDKLATLPWLAADEIYFGAEVLTDTPQVPDGAGLIKYRVPTEVQNSYPFIAVGAGV